MSGAPRFRSALFVILSILAGALVPLAGADAQPTTLVVTGYGGRWSDVMKKALVEPFEKKHGVKVEIVTGITTEWVAKLLAAGPDNPPYDVVFGNEREWDAIGDVETPTKVVKRQASLRS